MGFFISSQVKDNASVLPGYFLQLQLYILLQVVIYGDYIFVFTPDLINIVHQIAAFYTP